MPEFLKKALVSLVFDFLWDVAMATLVAQAERTETKLDDQAVEWLKSMKDAIRAQIKAV